MPGLSRFLSVLRCFDEGRPNWTVAEVAEQLGIPGSTVYRTVRELVSHGFLEPANEAHYRLGSAFIEFDRMVRRTDPLGRMGTQFLRNILSEVKLPCVVLLARLYDDRVICTADERNNTKDIPTSFERGRPMPLTMGSTSKVILAQLPSRKLKKLLPEDTSENELAQLKEELAGIRKRGYCITRGEVDDGLVGISVPVNCPELAISACISVVTRQADLDSDSERRAILILVSAGDMLTQDLLEISRANNTGH